MKRSAVALFISHLLVFVWEETTEAMQIADPRAQVGVHTSSSDTGGGCQRNKKAFPQHRASIRRAGRSCLSTARRYCSKSMNRASSESIQWSKCPHAAPKSCTSLSTHTKKKTLESDTTADGPHLSSSPGRHRVCTASPGPSHTEFRAAQLKGGSTHFFSFYTATLNRSCTQPITSLNFTLTHTPSMLLQRQPASRMSCFCALRQSWCTRRPQQALTAP